MPLFFYRTLYQKLVSNPKNQEFGRRHASQFYFVGWAIRIIVGIQILTVLPFLTSYRIMLFRAHGSIACTMSLWTLWNTHLKGPLLPPVRPPPPPSAPQQNH